MRPATILIISALSVGAFAQSSGKLKVNVSEITQSSYKSTQVQAPATGSVATPAPTRTSIGSQLAPPNRNQEDNRGEPVPEPATITVIDVGIGALLRRKKR